MSRTVARRALVATLAVVCALVVPAAPAGAAVPAPTVQAAILALVPVPRATSGTADPPPSADPGPTSSGTGPSWSGDVALVDVPVPEVVVRRAPDGTPTAYVLPDTLGVRWVVDTRPVADVGTRDDGAWRLDASPAGAPVVVVAVAEAGHRLVREDGTAASAVAVLDLRRAVAAVRPRVVDGDGTADAFVVPDVAGLVVADDAGTVLAPGSRHVVTGYVDHEAVVVLTLSAAPGHRLEVDGVPVEAIPGEGAPWLVELRFAGTVAVEPVAPTFTPGQGAAGTVTVPLVEGVEYRVGDEVTGPGVHAATGMVAVSARALDGYVLVGDAAWSHTFAAPGAPADASAVDAGPAATAGGGARVRGAAGPAAAAAGDDTAPVAAPAPLEPSRAAIDPVTLLVGGLVLGGLLLLRGRRDQVV
ncbi:hypothetical protein [Cellulosimicrobium sp. NPDC057127]|uniref:hypothetical protein n=1 Tax=Cellulosimicrobium sp. NPDC057127 TaxID=3346026 RepID=UPI00363E3AB6